MKKLIYTLLCLFCLLGYSKSAGAQGKDVFYGNDPVSTHTPPKPKPDVIVNISPAILDSLDLLGVAVETHTGYCDDAKPALIAHRKHGKAMISNGGPGCPLQFSFKDLAKAVNLRFTGCAGKYKLVGYDRAKNKVAEQTVEIKLWAPGAITIQSGRPNIAYVTFARGSGCSTYVKSVHFE